MRDTISTAITGTGRRRRGADRSGRLTRVAVVALACIAALAPDARAQTRVLFIGNSLTYVNDLPGMVVALAHAAGDTAVTAGSVALPDYSLEDHLAKGQASARLTSRRWTHVVLQQGPSSLPDGAAQLAREVARFSGLIRQAGATPVVYMVWPSRDRLDHLPAVHDAYSQAARLADACLAPAGDAWREAWSADSTLALYGPDDFHPSPVGSFLAALTILPCLGIDVPDTLPPFVPVRDGGVPLTRRQLLLLVAAARRARAEPRAR